MPLLLPPFSFRWNCSRSRMLRRPFRIVRESGPHLAPRAEMQHLRRKSPVSPAVHGYAVCAGKRGQKLETQTGKRLQGLCPVGADGRLALQLPGRLAHQRDDDRRGHLEIVFVMLENAFQVMRVPCGDPLPVSYTHLTLPTSDLV